MVNSLFLVIQIFLIIIILGRGAFFTNKEILLFSVIVISYAIFQPVIDQLSNFEIRILDLGLFVTIYILEILFIYKRKHALFLAAIFTIVQNTVLAVIWTIFYDIPLQNIDRRVVYLDSIVIQLLILLLLLLLISAIDKKFQFTSSFLAINKKYFFYSIGMMGLHSTILIIRQVLLFTGKIIEYYYLTIILMSFTLIFVMLICFINASYMKRLEGKAITEEIAMLESKNNLYQEFRHDYINILLGLKESLEEDDLCSAKKYLNTIIAYSSDVVSPNYYYNIKGIPNSSVQGILFNMLKQAQLDGLDVTIDVQGFPNEINMDMIDFIRCLSILVNNAVEHSTRAVFIGFYLEGHIFQVVVKNTFSEVTDIGSMFKKNFSTKKNHYGIGLYIFQKLMNTYTNTNYSVDRDGEWINFSYSIK